MRKVLLAVVALMTAVSASAQLNEVNLSQRLRVNVGGVPVRTASQINLQALEAPTVASPARRAPRRAAALDLNSLAGEYIGVNYPAADSVTTVCSEATVSIVDAANGVIQLEGLAGVGDTIQAHVNLQTGEIAIAPGQVFYTSSSYGNFGWYTMQFDENYMPVRSKTDSIKGIIAAGKIYITTPSIAIIESGDYEGYFFSELAYSGNMLARSNGVMTQTYNNVETTSNVYIEEIIDDENINDSIYYATVYNFGGFGVPVEVSLPKDSMAYILPQDVLYQGDTYGVYSPYGLAQLRNVTVDSISIDGASDASVLTFISPWSLVSSTGYWAGRITNTSIRYTDGSVFIYPPSSTGIRALVTDKQAVGVSYVNAAGQRSDKPFRGLNIVVTRYADGTQTAKKELR